MSASLLAVLRPEDADVGDFYSWYEAEHVTGRLGIPGFTGAHRYRTRDDRKRGILLYELEDLAVLDSPGYLDLQARTAAETARRMGALREFVRVTGRVIQEHGDTAGPAPLLFVVAFAAPPDEVDEVDNWYRDEHAPALLEADAWLSVRLLDVADATTDWSRVAVHRLSDESALSSPERRAAGDTPGRRRLAERPWFNQSVRFTAEHCARFDASTQESDG